MLKTKDIQELPMLGNGEKIAISPASIRAEAAARFQAKGWPTSKDEAWRFTNLNALRGRDFIPADSSQQAANIPLPVLSADAHLFVFCNGVFQAALSSALDSQGISSAPLTDRADLMARLHEGGHAVADLSLSAMTAGIVFNLEGDIAKPIHLIFHNSGDDISAHPIVAFDFAADSSAVIIEHHQGEGEGLSAPLMICRLGARARFSHARVQSEGMGRHHLGLFVMDMDDAADYNALSVQTGGGLSRTENRIALKGEHINVTMTTLYLARGSQVMDVTTVIDHQQPNCTSRQIVRGVLDDKAKGIFQGKVIVARHAQKTDGNQMSRALLLSRQCEADAKPELEIYADDVVCSHGATVGEIDDNQLFYLLSRGISKEVARQMLIRAFLVDVLDDVDNDLIRQSGGDEVSKWLSGHADVSLV